MPCAIPVGTAWISAFFSRRFHLQGQKPLLFPGGEFRLVSQAEFPISTTMTGAVFRLTPGAVRELHWHPNAAEWQYTIKGRFRLTVFASHGNAATAEFGPGDVGYVPQGFGHYLENVGDEDCEILVVLNSGDYQEISLSEWLASVSPELLATNFGVPADVFASFPQRDVFIAGGRGK